MASHNLCWQCQLVWWTKPAHHNAVHCVPTAALYAHSLCVYLTPQPTDQLIVSRIVFVKPLPRGISNYLLFLSVITYNPAICSCASLRTFVTHTINIEIISKFPNEKWATATTLAAAPKPRSVKGAPILPRRIYLGVRLKLCTSIFVWVWPW